mmetsp:Transcript_1498/g.2087  ORF Transcript_1498/g.2087 Transcript_1498/m.2087 type:complete len:220 (-) Transcript_1498:290-949(-)|eukprot:CAMPEP_0198137310 /NCGR_PEP_ID=MMETSP1443-20131203/832_1 /TAXON_ID=186043 /ORGANISM="Entomoneis sp., Strain CCMP2396" /LENGTH=219 /DNA_ID=CAMNT_0043798707 /DNA_START=72 /DNA_END=731 /DNA_ORIENTATION=-
MTLLELNGNDPLQNDWVLWEHKASPPSGPGSSNKQHANQWKDNMTELAHFSTVQEFWRNFNHLPTPSQVFFDGDCRKKVGPDQRTIEEFSLFKKGIEPEWGDPANALGGEWFCRQALESEVLDLFWQNLVFAVVGEAIEGAVSGTDGLDLINGIRVLDKSRGYPQFKIEIWINTRDPVLKEGIKDKLVELMTEGQGQSAVSSSARGKVQPKFDWKDHSP